MKTISAAALLALVPFVVAQSTPPACALTCIVNNLGSSGCSSVLDTSCLCRATSFQQTAAQCIESSCSASDAQAASEFSQQQCLQQGVTLSISGTGSAASAASSTAASSGSSSAASSSAASSSATSSSSSSSSSSQGAVASATSAAASGASSAASGASSAASSAAPSSGGSGAGFAQYKLSTAAGVLAGVAGVAAFAL